MDGYIWYFKWVNKNKNLTYVNSTCCTTNYMYIYDVTLFNCISRGMSNGNFYIKCHSPGLWMRESYKGHTLYHNN